jgi:serine/threonine protein kinase
VVDPAVAALWFDQILAGVEAAHRAGIIHRDLKPENVIISAAPDGGPLVKILDFGIAKINAPDLQPTAGITDPGTILGSIQYMSPEQLNGDKVEARSDIFAIGLMAFEVLTGRLPFSGRTFSEHVASLLHGDIAMPEISRSGIALESVLRRCLAKDPDARFATVAEVRHYLIPLLAQYKTFPADTSIL